MRFILNLIFRNTRGLVFLILQVIALSLFFSAQDYQRTTLLKDTLEVSGTFDGWIHSLSEYKNLDEINHNLNLENAVLKNSLKESYFSLYAERDTIIDTLFERQYAFLPGKIIGGSYLKRNNYLTLNIGKVHGIKPHLAVLSNNGIVGIVKDVSKHYSRIIPIIHSNFKISGSIKGQGFFGTVTWNGKDYKIAQFSDLPKHARINIGDTIISNEKSMIFPPGVPIGVVTHKRINEGDGFLAVTIKLTHDFSEMGPIYVVENLFVEEREKLEEGEE